MTFDEFSNLNSKMEEAIDKSCSCFKNATSQTNDVMNQYPVLSTSLAVGSILTTASIVSPMVRKITIPTCKYLIKQQARLLVGVGIFSLATYISNNSNSDGSLF